MTLLIIKVRIFKLIIKFKGYRLEIRRVRGFFDKIYDKKTAIDPFGNIQTGVEDIDN